MSLAQLIRERRSIRKFSPLPVSQDLVMTLLQKAEQLCPYDGEARWRYLYAGTPEARERLADYMIEGAMDNKFARLALGMLADSFRKRVVDAQANVIVMARTDADPVVNDEIYGTVCRILQNFQLLGWEQRLGMVWITEPAIQNERFFKRIGLQDGERFVGLLQIGYFDKVPKGRARTPAEKYWTEFDNH